MAERIPRNVVVDGKAPPEVHDLGRQLNGALGALFKGKDSAEASLSTLTDASEVTGSKGGNAALASLLSVLAAKGIITDSTT